MHNKGFEHSSIIETVQNSIIDITNEITKVRPRCTQAVSNFSSWQPNLMKLIQLIGTSQFYSNQS